MYENFYEVSILFSEFRLYNSDSLIVTLTFFKKIPKFSKKILLKNIILEKALAIVLSTQKPQYSFHRYTGYIRKVWDSPNIKQKYGMLNVFVM